MHAPLLPSVAKHTMCAPGAGPITARQVHTTDALEQGAFACALVSTHHCSAMQESRGQLGKGKS